MRSTFLALKKSASSSRWISRQSRDPYVKDRINDAGVDYRSRSSFKLVSLLEKYPQLLARHDIRSPTTQSESLESAKNGSEVRLPRPGRVVVDLGAAPGGWSQVIRRRLRRQDLVFALDILDMEPISGVEVLQGDFVDPAIQQRLRDRILSRQTTSPADDIGGTLIHPSRPSGLVDLVLSDMMGSMTGNRLANIRMSLDLVEAATRFALANLKSASEEASGGQEDPRITKFAGGHLVMKFFMHPDLTEFQKEVLEPRFRKVAVPKPKESRKESSETYFVCLGYKGEPL